MATQRVPFLFLRFYVRHATSWVASVILTEVSGPWHGAELSQFGWIRLCVVINAYSLLNLTSGWNSKCLTCEDSTAWKFSPLHTTFWTELLPLKPQKTICSEIATCNGVYLEMGPTRGNSIRSCLSAALMCGTSVLVRRTCWRTPLNMGRTQWKLKPSQSMGRKPCGSPPVGTLTSGISFSTTRK